VLIPDSRVACETFATTGIVKKSDEGYAKINEQEPIVFALTFALI
jgi:hypothetical protein